MRAVITAKQDIHLFNCVVDDVIIQTRRKRAADGHFTVLEWKHKVGTKPNAMRHQKNLLRRYELN